MDLLMIRICRFISYTIPDVNPVQWFVLLLVFKVFGPYMFNIYIDL